MFYKFAISLSIFILILISNSSQTYSTILTEDIRFIHPKTTKEGKTYSVYQWPSLAEISNNLNVYTISEEAEDLIDKRCQCQLCYKKNKEELVSLSVTLIVMKEHETKLQDWAKNLDEVSNAYSVDQHYIEIIEKKHNKFILYKNTEDTTLPPYTIEFKHADRLFFRAYTCKEKTYVLNFDSCLTNKIQEPKIQLEPQYRKDKTAQKETCYYIKDENKENRSSRRGIVLNKLLKRTKTGYFFSFLTNFSQLLIAA